MQSITMDFLKKYLKEQKQMIYAWEKVINTFCLA